MIFLWGREKHREGERVLWVLAPDSCWKWMGMWPQLGKPTDSTGYQPWSGSAFSKTKSSFHLLQRHPTHTGKGSDSKNSHSIQNSSAGLVQRSQHETVSITSQPPPLPQSYPTCSLTVLGPGLFLVNFFLASHHLRVDFLKQPGCTCRTLASCQPSLNYFQKDDLYFLPQIKVHLRHEKRWNVILRKILQGILFLQAHQLPPLKWCGIEQQRTKWLCVVIEKLTLEWGGPVSAQCHLSTAEHVSESSTQLGRPQPAF